MLWQALRKRLRAWQHWLLSSGITSRATKPESRPPLKKPVGTRSTPRKSRSLLMRLTALMLSCIGCTTKPAPAINPDRPCYQWVITQDQEVYVYDNGHLVARLETQPYDAVISGWCIMRNNEHLMNDIRKLSQ